VVLRNTMGSKGDNNRHIDSMRKKSDFLEFL
jgi:hypothetical protein